MIIKYLPEKAMYVKVEPPLRLLQEKSKKTATKSLQDNKKSNKLLNFLQKRMKLYLTTLWV